MFEHLALAFVYLLSMNTLPRFELRQLNSGLWSVYDRHTTIIQGPVTLERAEELIADLKLAESSADL